MELMFINSILRSPTFPPHDSWLSGYAISYYYFGYVMTAMLAMLTGLTGSVAHNLMTALIFALGCHRRLRHPVQLCLPPSHSGDRERVSPNRRERKSAAGLCPPGAALSAARQQSGRLPRGPAPRRHLLVWHPELLDLAGHQGSERGSTAAARLDPRPLLVVVARLARGFRLTTWPATSARSSTSFLSSPSCMPTCIRMCLPSRSTCWRSPSR